VDFAAYDFWSKPVGLLSVGAALSENGYDISLVDCMDRNSPAFEQHRGTGAVRPPKSGRYGTGHYHKEIIPKPPILKSVPRRYGRYGVPLPLVWKALESGRRPDAVFVTSGMTYWYPGVVDMVSLLKKAYPGVPVVLGGIYATLCHEHARRVSGADEVVKGEGECTAVRIADALTGHRSEKTEYDTADDLPFLPYGLYPQLESVVLLTSRGCPFRCPFCASHLLCAGYRKRNPEKTADEVDNLRRTRNVAHFAFYDDALLFDKSNHLVPLLRELISRNLGAFLHTPNGIHPRWVDRELAHLMKRAGFKTIRLGYESGNPERQKSMGLKVTDEELTAATEFFLEAGFERSELGAYVIMGLPGQTVEEILDSLVFVLKHGIKISAASFSPIPGTACWDEAVHSGFVDENTDPLLTNNSIFPMKTDKVGYADFVRIGTLAALGNRIVGQGGMPLEHPEFRSRIQQMLQTR